MGRGDHTGSIPQAGPKSAVAVLASVLLLSAYAAGCRGTETVIPEGTITREQFTAAWIDLRFAALEAGRPEPTPEARDSVLAAHDLSATDLFDFLEVHGRDVDYMRELWEALEDTVAVLGGEEPYS
jgi:hypothetical protein